MNASQTGDSELPAKPDAPPVGAPLSALDLDQLVPGAVWRGQYRVSEVLPDITYGKLMRAEALNTGRQVIIRSYRVTDDGRARACERLKRVAGGGIAGPLESLEVEGRRIEITEAIASPTLRHWGAGRKLGLAEIRALLVQLVEAVAGLHEMGVAHLNLKPDVIYATGPANSPRLVIGGLEAATDITVSCLVSITVDPFYAPPEAVGLFQHHCGPALRAWDWWSIGRVLQELVLGQHVLGVFLNRDVSRRTPELLMRADQFLREKQGATCRAGGVEVMPEMDPALTTLLRGLLSGCRDARWGRPDLEAWLRGEQVKERYHLGQQERLFVWKDRGYSVPEAAEYFGEASHWSDAGPNVFERENPSTLASFLAANSEYRRVSQRLDDLVRMSASSAFVDLDPGAVREVFTGIALGLLGNGALPLRLSGRRVDLSYLREMLQPAAQPKGLTLVEVLSETAAIQHISPFDADAGGLLMDSGHLAGSSIALAAANRWLSRAERERVARFRLLALEPSSELDARVAAGREKYAISRDDSLNALLTKTDIAPPERVILAFAFEAPDRYKLVTRADWKGEQYRILHDRGEKLALVSTWLHLAAAMRAAPHLIGPWPAFAAYWLVVGTSVAVAFPSRLTLALALAIFALAVIGRFVTSAVVRSGLRGRIVTADASRLPTPRNCDKEAEKLFQSSLLPAKKALEREITAVNNGIRALGTIDSMPVVRATRRFLDVRFIAMATALASIALLLGLGWRISRRPPQWTALQAAWLKQPSAQPKAESAPPPSKAVKHADEQEVETKMSWSYRPSDAPVNVRVSETREATAAESKAAAEVGRRVTDTYKRETIDQLVAVRIPTDDRVILMLYDGRGDKIADRRAFVAGYEPLHRSWVVLGDKVAIFLAD
ncbi:hypothetical protein DB347_08380 [Opitutaceae bacterium EW11]|nr:hypothetical protein DB347_08380 [Opitutaceae bacterium EW11]